MARRTIPPEDKEKVKRALIEGKSRRDAIKGTSIKSNSTANLIAKSPDIARRREEYLKKIENAGANDQVRAEGWAEMAQAMKPIGAKILVDKDGKTVLAEDQGVIEVPDWWAREKALKYIDTLSGIYEEKGNSVQVNNFVNPTFRRGYEE